MRTKTLLISGTSALLIAGTLLVSCQKNDELKSSSTVSSNDAKSKVATLQTLLNSDDAALADIAISLSGGTSAKIDGLSCSPTITYDNPPGVYPRTVTVDWGSTGCYKPESGLTRKGKTLTTYFGDMADTASTSYYIQTYDNYYVNDVLIEGQVKMSHNSRNQDPQNVYRQTFNNRKATQLNGDYTITNGAKRLVKQVDDGTYPGPIPNTGNFRVTGIVTGDVLEGGVSYQWRDSIDNANPIIWNACQFPVRGQLFIDFTNQATWLINYGLGTCDDQAERTINGVTETITLPFFRTDAP